MTIEVSKNNGVATLLLNRPDKLNALSEEMYHGIADRFVELDADDAVRAIASSSFTFLAGTEGCVTRKLVTLTACVIGAKSRSVS